MKRLSKVVKTDRVAVSGPATPKDITTYLKKLVRVSEDQNPEQAAQDYAEAVYVGRNPKLSALKLDAEALQEREGAIKADIQSKDKRLKETDQYIFTAEATRQSLRTQDKVWLVILITLACGALCLSAVNMAAVLFGSYDPFIMDNPWVGYALSCIMPLASMSVKLFIHAFDDNDHLKNIFTKSVYGLASVLTVVWVWLFAGEYHSMGDASFEDVVSGGGSGALVFVQLMLEVMVGSALVLRVSQILDLSQPNRRKLNPDYLVLEEALKNLRQDLEDIRKRHRAILTEIQQLEAQMQAFITETLAEFAAMKARHAYLSA